ncbi:MAG: hypothetical protein AB8H47_20970, partial [Bacteroidia bacterium]
MSVKLSFGSFLSPSTWGIFNDNFQCRIAKQFPILDLIFLAAQNAWVHKKGFACWQTPSKDQKAMMDNYGVPLK